MTDGVPRRINQLCDNALLVCRAEKIRKVSPKTLKRADEALRSDLIFTPGYGSAIEFPASARTRGRSYCGVGKDRAAELEVLTSNEVKSIIQKKGIRLVNYGQLWEESGIKANANDGTQKNQWVPRVSCST